MARDADALRLVTKWAGTGQVETPENSGLTRTTGWPDTYEVNGGQVVSRRVFNQLFRELSGLAREINTRGILEWDTAINYTHPAAVLGTNARVYISTSNSGPDNGGSVDPEGTSGSTRWAELVLATGDARWRRLTTEFSGDCDDLIESGYFDIHTGSATNGPPATNGPFELVVTREVSTGTSNRVRQDAWALGGINIERTLFWTRYSNNRGVTWSTWEDYIGRVTSTVVQSTRWDDDDLWDWLSPGLGARGTSYRRFVNGGLTVFGTGGEKIILSHAEITASDTLVLRGLAAGSGDAWSVTTSASGGVAVAASIVASY